MSEFGFKQITKENWLEPDKISQALKKFGPTGEFGDISGEEWLETIFLPMLSSDNVERMAAEAISAAATPTSRAGYSRAATVQKPSPSTTRMSPIPPIMSGLPTS